MQFFLFDVENTLMALREGSQELPSGVDTEEAIVAIQERLDTVLRRDAEYLLERTSSLNYEEQLAAWHQWLHHPVQSGDVSVDCLYPAAECVSEPLPWRANVYGNLKEVPTLPSFEHDEPEMDLFMQLAHERGANTSYDDRD
jgi:hypothetical protein